MRMQQERECGNGSASEGSTSIRSGAEQSLLATLTFLQGRTPVNDATIWLRPDGSAYQVIEPDSDHEYSMTVEYLGEHDQHLKGEVLGTVVAKGKTEASILME